MSDSTKNIISNIILVLFIIAGVCTAVVIVSNEVLERSCRNFGAQNQVEVDWVSRDFMLWGQCLVKKSTTGEWTPRPE